MTHPSNPAGEANKAKSAPASRAVHVSLPAALADAYRAAGATVPPLSALLQAAALEALRQAGHPAPALEQPPPRTAAATRARWPRAPR